MKKQTRNSQLGMSTAGMVGAVVGVVVVIGLIAVLLPSFQENVNPDLETPSAEQVAENVGLDEEEDRRNDGTEFLETDSAGPDTNVTMDDLIDDDQRYLDQTITVSAEVASIMNDRSFELEGTGIAGDDVLVLSRQPLNLADRTNVNFMDEGAVVRVTGQPMLFDTLKIEQEIGFDLADSEYEAWEGQQVLVADSVEVITPAE